MTNSFPTRRSSDLCLRSFGRSTGAPDMGNRKISVPPADDQAGETPPLPPPAKADHYSREFWSAAVTLVLLAAVVALAAIGLAVVLGRFVRSEEHTSELQSLMRSSYAVFCLKKKKQNKQIINNKQDKTKNKYRDINTYTIHNNYT